MKEIKHIILVLIVLGITSCGNKQVEIEKPKEFISKDRFIAVMTDIQLLEATYSQKIYDNDSIKYAIGYLYDDVLEKHQISDSIFEANFKYYSTDSDLIAEIYNEVLANIDQLEQEARRKSRREEK